MYLNIPGNKPSNVQTVTPTVRPRIFSVSNGVVTLNSKN